ncbi:hypothetical protein BDY17DRAFT_321975 [Neohortaea acidophila]|uniref:MARVEL domain-containing protein n=1 Tax=Neohortaea acidophila TaxID=245834 RepID=A0A6A6Q117_9PEZI|nr:uncharacterized protein BDY17DRAFT_321975 [Neohortaea acidophila]KAF2485107.1 hypothetical protein BDY17DRAFT_321975 [Neohortaea acidophila]
MGVFESIGHRSSSGGITGALLRLVLRLFQFVLALTVAGLYGIDLHHAHEWDQQHPPSQQVGADPKWVYAEVVAGLSAVACIVYGLPFFKSYWAFAWDWVLFILWTALFGVFGRIYITAHPTPKQAGIIRMKHAVWVDLASMILWFITAIYSTVIWHRGRLSRSMSSKV